MKPTTRTTIRIRPIRNASAVVVAAVEDVVVRMKVHRSIRRTASLMIKGLSTLQALPCQAPRLLMLNQVRPTPQHQRQHLPLLRM
jgi:hypothetical protein